VVPVYTGGGTTTVSETARTVHMAVRHVAIVASAGACLAGSVTAATMTAEIVSGDAHAS
jgi:hypothetical protein